MGTREYDPQRCREMLPEGLRGWVVTAEGHWLWDGPVNDWGYASWNGKNAAREIFQILVLGGPFHSSKLLERRCGVKACVHPGHMLYQNRAALYRKQAAQRWGKLLPEQEGRGCAHVNVCDRCGCGACAG